MYIVVEATQHKADSDDPSKAVARAVLEFESQGEFLIKGRRAWSGHPAAPTWLVVAGRNRVSISRQKEGKHAPAS
jgi:hypothetical protein